MLEIKLDFKIIKLVPLYFSENAIGTFFDFNIPLRAFHQNQVCKLQLERFTVALLITWIACILRKK